jgi:hypothetical protein
MASAYINDDEDVEMHGDAISCWVGVGDKFSVYIKRQDGDLSVEVFARGCEDCNPIADCFASEGDAVAMQKEGDE